jgi:hypothetical protein
MRASGTDKRGQGGAKALRVSTVRPAADGSGTQVDVETDFTITGRLASFSRGGMIKDISNRLLREFAECLQRTLAAEQQAEPAAPTEPAGGASDAGAGAAEAGAGAAEAGPVGGAPLPRQRAAPAPAPAKPISGFSLFFGALWERLRRLLGRRSR